MTSLITLTIQRGAALPPCDVTSHPKSRSSVQKAVRGIVSLSMVIWWQEETRSIREKMRPLPRESGVSSTWGMGSSPGGLMAFSFSELVVMRTPPSFLGT